MRLNWPQHLQASRAIELAGEGQRGLALALMGVSLLILAEDLLAAELPQPQPGTGSRSHPPH